MSTKLVILNEDPSFEFLPFNSGHTDKLVFSITTDRDISCEYDSSHMDIVSSILVKSLIEWKKAYPHYLFHEPSFAYYADEKRLELLVKVLDPLPKKILYINSSKEDDDKDVHKD